MSCGVLRLSSPTPYLTTANDDQIVQINLKLWAKCPFSRITPSAWEHGGTSAGANLQQYCYSLALAVVQETSTL
jgi:hypothetical protein